MFADALLQNPKIDTFLYGSPLEAGPRGGELNAGTLLAKGAKRLAEDYLNAMHALYNKPRPGGIPIPTEEIPGTTAITGPGEGIPADDFD
jgi:hypothetical protein